MNCIIGAKRLLTPNGWEENKTVEVCDGRIVRISEGKTADYTADIVTQGLIDPHLHGGDGFDIMAPSVEGLENWLVRLAESGVSAVLVSPYTGTMEMMRKSLDVINTVMKKQKNGEVKGAKLLGAHLEGPYISKNRLGAMEEKYIHVPTVEDCKELIAGYEDVVMEVSLAPEVEGCYDVINYLNSMGIKVQAGHCDATFEEGERAFNNGVGAVCHFFNASRPILHRDPGFLSAAIVNPNVYCEMITDLVHLEPGAVRFLWTCKGPDKVMLISDAVSTTNLPDGKYMDNGQWVIVKNGQSRVEGGSLNGGGTYLPGAVRNLVSLGVPAEQAINAASVNTARWLGIGCGVYVGAEARLTGWNEDLTPTFTLVGDYIHEKESAR